MNQKDYINQELSKYPYRDNREVPFRLERIDEHSWNVFELVCDMDYGNFVGFHEKQDDFDGCETLEQAIDYWTNYHSLSID